VKGSGMNETICMDRKEVSHGMRKWNGGETGFELKEIRRSLKYEKE
jgi:hypothetical protein